MAKIGNDRMIVQGERRPDGSWLFTVCYTAHFADSDLGHRFDDAVQIRPAHRDGDGAPGYAPAVTFRATDRRVFRKKRIVVRSQDYDPQEGLPSVCAWIRLQHQACAPDVGVVDDEQHTPVLVPLGAGHRGSARRATAESLRC